MALIKSLLALYFCVGITQSFVLVKDSQYSKSQLTSQTSLKAASTSRRNLVFGTAGMVVGIGTFQPDEARALKARDELLCGTGFFTNIAQWKCTDIGDILDEGQSKALDTKQESATDSLMSKMNLSFDDNNNDSGSKQKDSSTVVGNDKESTTGESQN
mmetsp:Transcript_1911/g.2541  ORF Transcript_1911/g.2541 Transcript_1911/m.2541 type:complete len:158 (-) Transcript_1911:131-604(-)|eukprot:CAMPEP_0195297660 /NCGR_PEP_ID=MMETSP0707-20130614/21958_1 /TAXON_ID=33640 /ORGANISM="Asterionellopsis glacialis, Strain CCMP134" /LENGTH=157 /DNA_ID=CAMNT_0040359541 /DNA_START=50 /DNA_END=523 /DNA_ORIENTATION=+